MRRPIAPAILAGLLTLGWLPSSGHTAAPGRKDCPVLVAPTVTDCQNGVHDGIIMYKVEGIDHPRTLQAVQQFPNYFGTLESRMMWPVETPLFTRTWRCDIALPGAQASCVGEGLPPPPGIDFQHSCTSYYYRTNVRGGSGNWSCYVDHDGPPPGGVPAGGIPDA